MKVSYIIDNILEAKTNLLRNIPRTILTSLGIVIGITSVIILVAITDGAKNIIEQQLVSLGAKTIVLKPIGRTASGVYRGQAADFSQNELKFMRQIPPVEFVSPIVKTSNQVSYRDIVQVVAVVGSNEDFSLINDWPTATGAFINRIDVEDGAKVCVNVLGGKMLRKSFNYLPEFGLKIPSEFIEVRHTIDEVKFSIGWMK